eukprot:2735015-Rhodomonas_salina.2
MAMARAPMTTLAVPGNQSPMSWMLEPNAPNARSAKVSETASSGERPPVAAEPRLDLSGVGCRVSGVGCR